MKQATDSDTMVENQNRRNRISQRILKKHKGQNSE